ncbi:MAG: peptidylprolyl isomerase [Verrucomicrobiales bacterium]
MTKFFKTSLILGAFVLSSSTGVLAGPKVKLATSHGDITIDLNEDKAPVSVENFLGYVKDGFYDNTVFHRVIEGFMVQGGGFALGEGGSVEQKETGEPIENEAKNGLENKRGTVAMARTGDPHSATAQFFINHGDNANLDHPSSGGWGYAVFGEVVEGMDVVDKIAALETTTKTLITKGGPSPMTDVPVETVVIEKAKVID